IRQPAPVLHYTQIFPLVKSRIRHRVDKGIEPFVHPRILPLIAAHDHREPVVPKFMTRHTPETSLPRPLAAKYDPRIFHPPTYTTHIGSGRIGELIQIVGVILDTALYIFGAAPLGGITGALDRIQ